MSDEIKRIADELVKTIRNHHNTLRGVVSPYRDVMLCTRGRLAGVVEIDFDSERAEAAVRAANATLTATGSTIVTHYEPQLQKFYAIEPIRQLTA